MSCAPRLIMDDEHTEHTDHTSRIVRAADLRPSWRQVAWRSLVVTVTTAIALWVLAAILEGFTIDTARGCVCWPASWSASSTPSSGRHWRSSSFRCPC